MAARKKKNLVIVESPTKAKTINKYLGPDYTVLASYGHVRDLPHGRKQKDEVVVGINVTAGWVPRYVVSDKAEGKGRRSAKDILNELAKEAERSETVFLATDPDREGEAIAWHLKEAMGLADEQIQRVTFNEITKRAVQDAFAHARQIDMDLVDAQEARRILDRVVGYKLSPLLGKKVARGLSAGRVQSVAVRLIVDREREIQAFKPEEYWKITAILAPEGTVTLAEKTKPKAKAAGKGKAAKAGAGAVSARKKSAEPPPEDGAEAAPEAPPLPPGAFAAELAEWAGKKFEANNGETAGQIVAALQGAQYSVAKVEQKDRPEKPPAPFTTSTLQQQASIRLRFPTRKTMQVAQRLYEGVDLGPEGSIALITYMRTDSTRVSTEALQAVREHIGATYGGPYLPAQPNYYASGKSAQEAHEAIRPTDVNYTPERVAPYLPSDQLRLYTLIYNRFVASQMTPAIFAVTNVDVLAQASGVASAEQTAPSALATTPSPAPAQGIFKAQGKILKFDGYRRVLAPGGKQEDALLPPLTEKQLLDLHELRPTQHFTQPPPRYNEASLVKTLEKEGIGRPSTYASIIGKIEERGYVEQKDRRFHATEMGMLVTDLLVQHFPKVLDLKFTSHMEEELDLIESRKTKRNEVLQEFWDPFTQALLAAESQMLAVRGIETGEKCPKCERPMVFRYSKKTGNKFAGCSGYPECDYIKRDGPDGEGPVETEHACPTCGKPMLQRAGKRGPFLGCSGYPECKTTMNFDAEGKPVLASRATEHECDKCGKPMVLREGPRGPFLACTGYPKCRNAKDVDIHGNPIKPIDPGVKCDKCGGPMAVKRGPRGPFLGCAAYPKCRSTKPVPDELKEKLKELMPAPAKKAAPAVEVNEVCPDCGSAMKVRMSRRGPFLGCSKYPKCKGTKEASAELVEQLQASAT